MSPPTLDKLLERGVRAHRAGRLQDAIACYRKALRRFPDDAEALSLHGLALLHSGRPGDAEKPLRRAVTREPQQPGFRLNLLELLERTGRLEDARAEVDYLLEHHPDVARGWEKSADFAAADGNGERAVAGYRRALALEPGNFGCAIQLARALLTAGELAGAESAVEAAAALYADHDAVHRLRLDLLTARRDWPALEASGAARSERHPQDPTGWYALAKARFEQGLYRGALEAYERLLALTPEDAAALTAYGRLCMHAHEFSRATEALARAETLDRDLPEMLAARGMMATWMGRFAEAEAYTRRCLELNPGYAPAYTQLSELTQGRLSDAEIETLAALAADAGAPFEYRATASFALADARDARSDIDAAFAAYRAANELGFAHTDPAGRYDAVQSAARTERIMSLFPEPAPTPTGSPAAPRPIFVVGMPRSGTTLLESVLSAHSRVSAGGERTTMPQLLAQHLARSAAGSSAGPDADLLEQWRAAYRREPPAVPESAWLTDKNPLNFEAIGLIARLFPDSPIVHIRRDPLETGLSIFRHQFSRLWSFTHRLEDIGHYYVQYARLMDHWERTLGGRLLTIQYEDFAGDLDRLAPMLLAWCGLDWEAQCASFQDGERPIATLSAVQARQPVTIRVGKATRYRRHLGPLIAALENGGVNLRTGARAG